MILVNESLAAKLTEIFKTAGVSCVAMHGAAEMAREVKRSKPSAVFVQSDLLSQVQGIDAPVIAMVDEAGGFNVSALVRSLNAHPSLAHIISTQMLASPLAPDHLHALIKRTSEGAAYDMLGHTGGGRVAKLHQASHREARFTRMQAYFEKNGVAPRSINTLLDVAEELVMNALYNAPSEAGFFDQPVSRTEDVSLPLARACEISYGMEQGSAFIRLRDTFGALRRERLLEVLNRCNSEAVKLDESRGGAGLGLWRIFSAATTISVTVLPGHLTDIVVRISPRSGRAQKQLLAVHLFFEPAADEIPAELAFRGHEDIDRSITLLLS